MRLPPSAERCNRLPTHVVSKISMSARKQVSSRLIPTGRPGDTPQHHATLPPQTRVAPNSREPLPQPNSQSLPCPLSLSEPGGSAQGVQSASWLFKLSSLRFDVGYSELSVCLRLKIIVTGVRRQFYKAVTTAYSVVSYFKSTPQTLCERASHIESVAWLMVMRRSCRISVFALLLGHISGANSAN